MLRIAIFHPVPVISPPNFESCVRQVFLAINVNARHCRRVRANPDSYQQFATFTIRQYASELQAASEAV